MKRIAALPCIIALALSFIVSSCKKETNQDEVPSQVEFTFGIESLKSLKSVSADTISGISSVVVTVEDLSGKVVLNSGKIDLYNMNGSFISKPISLVQGSYKITRFLVLDWKNNIVYATPLSGSAKAYLVQRPLPVNFSTTSDSVTKVTLEVLNAASSTPEEFGYTTFDFTVTKTFDFLLGVFVYDDSIKNFKLTGANISISGDSSIVVYTDTLSNLSGITYTNLDSINITHKITLPERFNKFTLTISKKGFRSYKQTFTKEELKMHFRSRDKGPLVVILDKLSLNDGLIAYYKFDGDLLDYSGNNNHGTFYGRGVYGTDKNSYLNKAFDLNGSTDYVEINNLKQLNDSQMSICAWYYCVPFYGNGNNAIFCRYPENNYIHPDFLLSVRGSYYGVSNPTSTFAINTINTESSINTIGPANNFTLTRIFNYISNNWYFIVATYDGVTQKLYINGELLAYRALSGNIINSQQKIYIGKTPNINRPEYDYLQGKVDDIRIYNRAIDQKEIQLLYNE